MMFVVATMGPPCAGTTVEELLREFKEADEPVCCVEPDSWLVRGGEVMLFCEKPPTPLEEDGRVGAVFVRARIACAMSYQSIRREC